MNKSLRPLINLTGQSFAYGMGIYGRQIIVYLTLPLFTTYLSQQEYGVVSIILSFYTVINTLTNVGLPSATFRIYNDRDEDSFKRQTLGSAQVLFFGIASLTAALIAIFAKPLTDVLLGSSYYFRALQLIAVLLILETMNNFGNIMLRLQVKPVAASVQSLIFISTQIGTALLLILSFKLGVVGYWLGYLIGALVGLILMVYLNWDFIVFDVSLKQIKELLSYGLPLVPATFSINLIRLTDNYLIRSLISVDQVAVYAIGYKIGSLVNMVIGPFNVAWPNFAFTTMHKPNAKKTYRDVLTFLFAGSIFIALTVYLFRDGLVALLTPISYINAADVVMWIALAMVSFGIYPILSLGPKIKRQTYQLAWISVLTTIVNILLNLLLIPYLGITGVALSTFISYFILAGVSYLISQRLYSLPLDWIRLLKVLIALIVTASMAELLVPSRLGLVRGVFYRLPILLVYPVLLLLLRFLSMDDIQSAFSTVREYLSDKFGKNV